MITTARTTGCLGNIVKKTLLMLILKMVNITIEVELIGPCKMDRVTEAVSFSPDWAVFK